MTYALDTNIILKYLRGDTNVHHNFAEAVTRRYEIIIPVMVDYEMRRGFRIMHAPSPKKESAYKILTEQCQITGLDEYFGEQAINVYADLYQKGFSVGDMDMLIAAFCLEYDCALVTNNTKDFENISGLRIIDWTQSQT